MRVCVYSMCANIVAWQLCSSSKVALTGPEAQGTWFVDGCCLSNIADCIASPRTKVTIIAATVCTDLVHFDQQRTATRKRSSPVERSGKGSHHGGPRSFKEELEGCNPHHQLRARAQRPEGTLPLPGAQQRNERGHRVVLSFTS